MACKDKNVNIYSPTFLCKVNKLDLNDKCSILYAPFSPGVLKYSLGVLILVTKARQDFGSSVFMV
jgi:hypothetical protein